MSDRIVFSLKENGTFSITLANVCIQKPPYIHFRRKPSEFILYYIYEGEFFLMDGDNEYHITKDDILILDPSREHYGLRSTECKFAYVHFTTDSFFEDKSASGISIPKFIHISSSNNVMYIRDYLASLISVFNNKSMYFEEMSSNLLANVLLCIALEYNNFENETKKERTKSLEISLQILEYINGNYSRQINSREIEEALGYNFDYLNRCLKKHTNYTIINYLNMIRIEKAKAYISSGLYSLESVASNVGFTDVYYFNKVFKKYTGVTPGKYRRNVW